MTRAMLLCAGYGTRLGALSDERPKPLLPVCDIPILRYGVAHLVGHGIVDIVINLHHKGELIEAELGDGSDLGARIRYTREHEILGTGGGLKHALDLLDPDGRDEPFVSMNGKLIFDVDLAALLAAHCDDSGVLGTMVVRRVPDALTWGAVHVEEAHDGRRVRDILGAGEFMFCGVHVTRPSVVRNLPDGEACMVRQGYLPWIREGGQVGAFEHAGGYFAEHSTPRRYLESNFALLDGASLSSPPGILTGIDEEACVDAGARVTPPVRIAAGARIEAGARVGPHAVVGRGAQVLSAAAVDHSVIWPGATARGRHSWEIVTAGDIVPAGDD